MIRSWDKFHCYDFEDKKEMKSVSQIKDVPQKLEPNPEMDSMVSKISLCSMNNALIRDKDMQNGYLFIAKKLQEKESTHKEEEEQ